MLANRPKFKEEATYCVRVINNDTCGLQFVPIGIVTHKLNQTFELRTDPKQPKQDCNAVYDSLKEALEINEKVFNYNMLDLGCCSGAIALKMRKDQLLHFVLGVEANKNLADYCRKLSIGPEHVYNNVINQDGKLFLDSKAQTNMKFDIIMALGCVNYSINPEFFLTKLKTYINKDGLVILTFFSKEEIHDYIFDIKLEVFLYNQNYIAETATKHGWQIVKQSNIARKRKKPSEMIMILKLNEHYAESKSE
ncbi:SAM-dependent methyltransferase [Candidatus Bandiella woodruffii]|uniref:SAM-dependent methyltransferase n=1 Tax=Candidatus Bandiella euplotis TaxID=1664265 RepID=A0ABZ0UKA0_9RICK|nr:SAM-dependent methyltransferase [Candidatus Bandiella woodruffii]